MIEGITPQLLMVTLFMVIVATPVLTLTLSLSLLQLYRRSVVRIMDELSGFTAPPDRNPADWKQSRVAGRASSDIHPGLTDGRGLLARLDHAPRRNAARYLLAGSVFALVMALAAQQVFKNPFGLAGVSVGLWIYLWPAFLAVSLIVQRTSWQKQTGWFAAYGLVYVLLSAWIGTINNLPEIHFGAAVVPARSTATPAAMAKLWLSANAGPTVLMILSLNRRVRAVAPLVLAFSSVAIAGIIGVYFAVSTRRGVEAFVDVATFLHIPVYGLLLGASIVAVAVFGWLGWLLMRRIARAYRRRRVSDQTLQLDALWLLFAATYSMWLTAFGIVWATTGLVAFLAFKLTLRLVARRSPPGGQLQVNLTFLRVFSLGRRSEQLLEKIAARWRYLGAIELITGPDLAKSTIRPDQFLDFLAGSLRQHFVSDPQSLARGLATRDLTTDPDQRYRVNSFFCYADSWKAVLPHLVDDGDLVLMDLRSFTAENAGCLHEIHHLVATVPYARCLLVVDDSTDRDLLARTIAAKAADLDPVMPNHGRPPTELALYDLSRAPDAAADLLECLCARVARVHAPTEGPDKGGPIL